MQLTLLLRRSLLALTAATAVAGSTAASTRTVHAAFVTWGTPLVQGAAWAGQAAALGDVSVYSNGDGNQDAPTAYGLGYECVELAQRWAAVRFGEQRVWPVATAAQMWTAGPGLRLPFLQNPNGGASGPQFGDLLIFGATASVPTGHVAVVSGRTNTTVSIVEQNWGNANPTGTATLPITGTTMAPRWGLPIVGWLRASTAPLSGGSPAWVPDASGPGGYLLDGWGGVHPYGSAPSVTSPDTAWTGFDIARGIVRSTPKGGYVLDGFGGVHAFGTATPAATTAYWNGWDIARGLALRPDHASGYTVDAFGGLHAFGNAPATVAITGYWPHWDIVRGVALRADGASGYTLDGWGAVHPFGGAPALPVSAYWPNWDIARGLTLNAAGDGGWVLDGYAGLHPFGSEMKNPTPTYKGYTPGHDIARGLVVTGAGAGYTTSAPGTAAPFGGMPSRTVDPLPWAAPTRGIS